MRVTRRTFGTLATSAIAAPALVRSALGQSAPVRIGLTICKTGALSSSKAGLAGYELWREDVNKAGGLLGRPVEFVTYDDQSSVAQIPSLYSKLIDIDKVDILIGPYGANLTAPLMPILKARDRFCIGMFPLGANDGFRLDKFFQSVPWGPNAPEDWAQGFFDIAKANGCKRLAILAADLEFSKTSAAGGEKIAAKYGMDIVFKQTYPGNINDFSLILRNMKAQKPDAVFVCAYPPDSNALVRGLSEVGVGDSVKLLGGSMVGLQYASLMTALGPALNGVVNYTLFAPEPTLSNPKISAFLDRYKKIATAESYDPLGFYIPPFAYVAGQMIEAAVAKAGSIKDADLAKALHTIGVETIAGNAHWNEIGDWTERRILMVQFRDIVGKDVDQFRKAGREVILDPPSLKSGDLIAPFTKAHGS